MKRLTLFLFSSILFFSACASSDSIDTGNDTTLIISQGNIFATTALTATSGGVVTVVNDDDTLHTIASESAEDAFDNTGSFNITVTSQGTEVFTLPTATSGTVFFFYCAIHTSSMTPANGTITIE